MESSIDNDRFLYSLESAVFTGTDANSTASLPRSDDVESGSGSLYPPLPPGSPVVGFAYLGLGGLREEEDEEIAPADARGNGLGLREGGWWRFY